MYDLYNSNAEFFILIGHKVFIFYQKKVDLAFLKWVSWA